MNEKDPHYYDLKYSKGGYNKEYFKSYSESMYKPIYDQVLDFLSPSKEERVFEIGCGAGILGGEIIRRGVFSYLGIDFSSVAIQKARESQYSVLGRDHRFEIGDIYTTPVPKETTHVVSTEVLEHVEKDVEIVSAIPRGVKVIFSVPNFPGGSHLRVYPSKNYIFERFKGVVKIINIFTRKRTIDIGTSRVVFVLFGEKI